MVHHNIFHRKIQITGAVAEVKRIVHANMESWSSWSQCSKSCLGTDEVLGFQSRTRKCIGGQNGGKTCNQLNAENVFHFSFSNCTHYTFFSNHESLILGKLEF